MEPGFTIQNDMMLKGSPTAIMVANYEPDNEIVNWMTDDSFENIKADKTRADIGFWKIKYKSHVKTP